MPQSMRKNECRASFWCHAIPTKVRASACITVVEIDHEGQKTFLIVGPTKGVVLVPLEILLPHIAIKPEALVQSTSRPAINVGRQVRQCPFKECTREFGIIEHDTIVVARSLEELLTLQRADRRFCVAGPLALGNERRAFFVAEKSFSIKMPAPIREIFSMFDYQEIFFESRVALLFQAISAMNSRRD